MFLDCFSWERGCCVRNLEMEGVELVWGMIQKLIIGDGGVWRGIQELIMWVE